MATLYENLITGDTTSDIHYGVYWRAQTFTVGTVGSNVTHTVTSVILQLLKTGTPTTDITASIRAVDVDGKPTGIGTDLCSGTLASSSLTTSAAWYEITLGAGTLLLPSTKYAIVVRTPSADALNAVWWRYRLGGYGGGSYVSSSDSGDTWTLTATQDFMFEEWGESAEIPTVTTQAVTDISGTIATGNGNITSIGEAAVTAHGVCWDNATTPTTTDSGSGEWGSTNEGAATTGAFTTGMTGLTAGTKYYVRAYATNDGGTAYGNEVAFWADKGTVFPIDPIARVTNIIHRYNRSEGVYDLELNLGDVTSDFGLPTWLSKPASSAPTEGGVQGTPKIDIKPVQPETTLPAKPPYTQPYISPFEPAPIETAPIEPKPRPPREPGGRRRILDAARVTMRYREIRSKLSDPNLHPLVRHALITEMNNLLSGKTKYYIGE